MDHEHEPTRPCRHDRDLRHFLGATEHLPNVDEQYRYLHKQLDQVMDNELISSLEAVLHDAGMYAPPTGERQQLYGATLGLLKLLRDLRHARLRAAIMQACPAFRSS
jgi:hypothetical protein